MTCTVSGILLLSNGAIAASRVFRFGRNPVSVVAIDGSGVVPDLITVTTDALGAASQLFQFGTYVGHVVVTDASTQKGATVLFALNVPDTASATWGDCIANAPAPGTATFPAAQLTGTISDAQLAPMATARIKGRVSAGTGAVEALTGTQATALLDAFASGAKGLAPASGGGTVNYLRADGTWAAPAGGGGVTDGDKGDITVSGGGATWTIDAGAVTLADMANMATASLIYRKTAGTGAPEVNTLATLKTDLGLTGTNAGDQTSIAGITGTKAQFDTAVTDGNIQYVGDAPTSHTHLLAAGATDVTITAANLNALDDGVTTALHFHNSDRDRANHTGTQAAGTITGLSAVATSGSATDLTTGTLPIARVADGAVTLAKMANLNANSIMGNNTGSPATPLALTAAQATSILDVATAALKGLGPVRSGVATEYLSGTGVYSTPPGGVAGSTREIQYNNAGTLAGATEVEIEGNQLRLDAAGAFVAPVAGGVKLIGRADAGRTIPAFLSQDGMIRDVQTSFARSMPMTWKGMIGIGSIQAIGMRAPFASGVETIATFATTSLLTRTPRSEVLVAAPATNAVAGFRTPDGVVTVGGASAGLGGVVFVGRWGPSTGVATTTNRAIFGLLRAAYAPADNEPSTMTDSVFMGWDAADTNVQIMHNDGAGTCTKIDLGASFPVPTTDRTAFYELSLFSPSGTTQSVDWLVTDLVSLAVASGTITTNLPSTTALIRPLGSLSAGGTSSVMGIMMASMYLDTPS